MSTFLQYEDRGTRFHRLHPTTKVVVFLSSALLASLWWDVRYVAALLAVEMVALTISKVPRAWMKGVGVVVILSLPVMLPTAVLTTNPAVFHVLPQSFVSIPIFIFVPASSSPTGLPIGFTGGNVYWMFAFELRLLTILFAAMLFVYTTSSSELVEWLLRRGIPYAVGYVVMVTLKFIPILIEDTKRIIWAQRLRGWEVKSRNPVNVIRQLAPIAIPITDRVLRLIDDTELSAVSRAFGFTKGVSIMAPTVRSLDYIISVAFFVLAAVAIPALILTGAGSI